MRGRRRGNDLRVTVYDPLRGVPAAELEVRGSYATGKHYEVLRAPEAQPVPP